MRATLAAVWLWPALGCTFSAHPRSGVQACSTDNPPRCPDGYTCVSGLCYENGRLPDTGGGGGGPSGSGGQGGDDSAPCTPIAIDCGKGSGKRCGKLPDGCNGTVECGTCISGESCQSGRLCAVACGGTRQPCCTSSRCNTSDTVCVDDICTPCGGAGQPCCAGAACTSLGASCADDSVASPDGGTNKLCLLSCVTLTGACISGTDQDCTSTCGPGKIGVETCACTANVWKCSLCTFPTGDDYSCYRLPATVSACDPTTPPTAGATCTALPCAPCGSATGKGYVDATGTARAGYCICTSSRWNCAPTKQWPCPGNSGC